MSDIPEIFESIPIRHKEFVEMIPEVLEDLKQVLVKKNFMYGNSSMSLGLEGNFVHVWDKASRYRRLLQLRARGEMDKASFEGLADTVKDIAGYGVLGILMTQHELSHLKMSDDIKAQVKNLVDDIRTGKLDQSKDLAPNLLTEKEQLEVVLEKIFLSNMDRPEIFATMIWTTILETLKRVAPSDFIDSVKEILFLRENP